MQKFRRGLPAVLALAALAAVGLAAFFHGDAIAAQQGAPAGRAPVQMTVSAEPRKGDDTPMVNRDDVMVNEGRDRDTVANWIPALGDHAGLELLILVDDGSSLDLPSHFTEIRAFMQKQPASTQIAIGYMRFGIVEMRQDFTADRVAAGKALRIPMGIAGANTSPYFTLQDLTKKWPSNSTRPRHEILMITNGIDPNYPGGAGNPYVVEAIGDLQRAGVQVYSIYEPGAGHAGHSFWRINWGQSYLSQLCDETGGESYYIGSAPAVAFTPYLDRLSRQLQHQYLLTFTPKPRAQSGLQPIRVSTEAPNVDLVSADKVFVPSSSE
jgi:hypothetical protein